MTQEVVEISKAEKRRRLKTEQAIDHAIEEDEALRRRLLVLVMLPLALSA